MIEDATMAGRHAAPLPADHSPAREESVRVVSGSPTPEEIAAAAIVVATQLSEEASRETTDDDLVRSPWELSQRNMRTPLRRGASAWRFPWA